MQKYPLELTKLLTLNRTPLQRKLHTHEDTELCLSFMESFEGINLRPAYENREELAHQIADFLSLTINIEMEAVAILRKKLSDFKQQLQLAVSVHEKRGYILAFAASLGADKRCLRRDQRAFRRWFGADTVIERCRRQIAGREYRIVDILNRLGNIVVTAVQTRTDEEKQKETWERINLEELTQNLLLYQGDPRVRIAAFGCLARGIGGLPMQLQMTTLREVTVTFIHRSAMASQEHIWIQCEALSLLALIAPHSFLQAIKHRFSHPREGDALFIRRRVIHLLGKYDKFHPKLPQLISHLLYDPSPFVRQALTETLGKVLASKSIENESQVWQWLVHLTVKDGVHQVRASAVLALTRIAADPMQESEKMHLLKTVLLQEKHPFVLKVALDTVARELEIIAMNYEQKSVDIFKDALLPHVISLHQQASVLSIKRWAAHIREKMVISADPANRELKQQIIFLLKDLSPGKSRKVPCALIKKYGKNTLGRLLSVLSQDDFGYSLHSNFLGCRIKRGDTFSFRLWRLLHEMRHPSTDKRQGHLHTIGRLFKGDLFCPSAILGELTETQVPGEPRFMASENSWRPYLPLPDQILSCLQNPFRKLPVKLYTAEGITEIHPPRSAVRRWLEACRLTFQFSRFAEIRNWEEEGSAPPDEYINALKKLGVRIKFIPHRNEKGVPDGDSNVERFFLFPLPFLDSELFSRIRDYFFSVYENTLPDLAIFTIGLLIFFVGSRFIMSRIAIHSRRKIDLVIGGWGTRGKSGTERLKAALIESLGHSLVSKSTGCEAMFLYAYPFGKTREMFLFRPYDKATIWEQYDVVRLATKLSSRVFLWECMALGPDYVRILQHQWMRDDYSTITNTYPDHEDVQGPAGYDIPKVMTEFIPKGGNLITSEEQMLPFLKSAATQSGTKIQKVGWLQAGMLTPDILVRFPYEEHPYNIALVTAMAKELGIDPDFALKEMADRVIADIGVLKEFPKSRVRNRDLQFINGMSANERFGALSNWHRLGFDKHVPQKEPGIILSTVVNNRADRVSRSQMFAKIIVEDFAADYHFLIGSNLEGLMGYIHKALEDYCQRISLQPQNNDTNSTPLMILTAMARRQRIPVSINEVQIHLDAVLAGIGLESSTLPNDAASHPAILESWLKERDLGNIAAEVLSDIRKQLKSLSSYQELYIQVESAGRRMSADLDEKFRQLTSKWFLRKIIVIKEFHATGEQIINRICLQTPPGLLNRIMGLQNIKGTGLDFVYRWQAWELCHQTCKKILSTKGAEFEHALHELSAFQEYGLLSENHVEKTCEILRNSVVAQGERYQAEITLIKSTMKTTLAAIHSSLSGAEKENNTVKNTTERIVGFFESMVDAGDAVRRRKCANTIYKDLTAERISGERAVKELRFLNRRQKGGWLWDKLERILLR